jgi:hypothetical protein
MGNAFTTQPSVGNSPDHKTTTLQSTKLVIPSPDGTISYGSQQLSTLASYPGPSLTPKDDLDSLQVLEVDVELTGKDSYAAIETASLLLRGILLPMRLEIRFQPYTTESDTLTISKPWKD